MIMKFKASYRDRNGIWHELYVQNAYSMKQARDLTYSDLVYTLYIKDSIELGDLCETHRVMKGKTVYEYDHGAICIERL